MHRLDVNRYELLGPLAAGMDMHLALHALLDGSIQGEVFVDRPDSPATMIAWTGHVIYLVGRVDQDGPDCLTVLLRDTVLPHLQEGRREAYEVKYREAHWSAICEQATPPGMKGVHAHRQYYEHTGPLPSAAVPAGFRLAAIEPGLLASPLKDIDALKEELVSERSSVAEFLEKSFGLAALKEDRLAGWCTSEYNVADRCEIGIGTQEPDRRQGLATALGAAFLALTHERGIQRVGWHCFASNQPSVATALRLGLRKQADYSTWIAWFKP